MQELSRYRSDFFGRLREDPRRPARHPHRRRPLRLPVGSAVPVRLRLSSPSPGKAEMDKLAAALNRSLRPRSRRRDRLGAARRRPHRTVPAAIGLRPRFRDNWELSSARAIAVVRYLIARGVLADQPRRRRIRRVPADRAPATAGSDVLRQEPPHRAEADGRR